MSCLPEWTWAMYADGELEGEAARRADAHLIHCESCRAQVLALREEALLLGGLFRERPAAAPVVLERAARPEGTRPLLARPPALVGVALLLGAVGTAVEVRLAAGGSVLAALDPRTLLGQAFGLVFMLRDRAPGLFELALGVAATAGASGLATFALTGLLRRWMGPALLVALLGLGLPRAGGALEQHFHDDVHVAPGERIEGTLLASGEEVEVEGVVAGDLYAGAHRVRVSGVVEGNLFVFTDDLEIDGRVDGNLIGGAERMRLRGSVTGSIYAVGEDLELAAGSSAGRDVHLFARQARLDGRVERDVHGFVESLELRGPIGRDVAVRVEDVTLAGDARVAGSLEAYLPPGTAIDGDVEGRVAGETRVEFHRHDRDAGLDRYLDGRFWIWLAVRITAAFLVGLLLHAFAPALFRPGAPSIGRAFGLGVLVLVGAPVALVVLGITLVGLPLALFGAFAYLTALYVGGVLAAGRLGVALLEPEAGGSRRAFGLALLVGLLALAVGSSLPFFGDIVRLLAALAGLGILAQALRDRWVAARSAT